MKIPFLAFLVPVTLGALYLFLFVPASHGWGLPSQNSQGSFWYLNNTHVYRDRPSTRVGSLGGPSRRSGLSGGK